MRKLPLVVVLALVAVVMAGCLQAGTVRLGPSTGGWTETSATPYFARVGYAGMCDTGSEPCRHATVIYTFGHVLWFSYARHVVHDEENQTMVASGLHVPDESYRRMVAEALEALEEPPGQYVTALTTATMPKRDADAVQHRFYTSAVDLADPGPVTYDCTDHGEPRLVFLAGPSLDAEVADRDGACGSNAAPQEGWFRIRDQADAVQEWIAPQPWNRAEGVVQPGARIDV